MVPDDADSAEVWHEINVTGEWREVSRAPVTSAYPFIAGERAPRRKGLSLVIAFKGVSLIPLWDVPLDRSN